jgi:hypothetical protein
MKSLPLDGRIGQADLTKKFRSAALKPAEIVGVVDDSHLIGIAVNDAVRTEMFEARCPFFHGKLSLFGFADFLNAPRRRRLALTSETEV